jgi:nuclear factor of activated T-cells 5
MYLFVFFSSPSPAQPPGQPEICKKSLAESPAKGGQELFIIGKNFLKDTKVVLQEETAQGELLWEARADVLKDYLQQV